MSSTPDGGVVKPLSLALCLALSALLFAHASGSAVERRGTAIDEEAFYPEGVEVIGEAVYWAEMPRDRIRRFSAGASATIWNRKGCGPTAVRRTAAGNFWVLCHLDHKVLLLDSQFRLKREITTDAGGNRLSWPNDGKVDGSGRLYFSSAGLFSVSAPAEGYVVTVGESGPAQRIAGPFRYTNGIALTRDGKSLFVSEHIGRKIWRLRLQGAQVRSREIFFDLNRARLSASDFDKAGPDGLYLTRSSELIAAEYGASRLLWITPQGRLKRVIPVPFKFVTNLAARPDGRGLVVTGTYSLDDPQARGRVIELNMPDLLAPPARRGR